MTAAACPAAPGPGRALRRPPRRAQPLAAGPAPLPDVTRGWRARVRGEGAGRRGWGGLLFAVTLAAFRLPRIALPPGPGRRGGGGGSAPLPAASSRDGRAEPRGTGRSLRRSAQHPPSHPRLTRGRPRASGGAGMWACAGCRFLVPLRAAGATAASHAGLGEPSSSPANRYCEGSAGCKPSPSCADLALPCFPFPL